MGRLRSAARAVLAAIERKDRYTAGHTRRVAHFAEKIAREMGIAGEAIERVRLAAIFHDAGKLGVDDAILMKPAPLTESERAVMSRHPELGSRIVEFLGSSATIEEVLAGMRFHHERWDGQGYPEKRRGHEIPWVARIVAVADAYDAITSHRPYRRGVARQIALDELSQQRGRQFCPEVIDAFVRAFAVEQGSGSGHHGGHVLV